MVESWNFQQTTNEQAQHTEQTHRLCILKTFYRDNNFIINLLW